MTPKIETVNFLNDLEKVARVKTEVADSLSVIANYLKIAEREGSQKSGRLELERDLEDIDKIGQSLKQGLFRLLVLGDMKRGKSTFLNALIGENLLPSDVNPCTAILTVLRYGPEKKVTIHFNDGTQPEAIDFKTFKTRYTIDPEEAKQLEQKDKQAFPNIDCAVVEYPLALLEKGIEIIDSPGLNDTEARNELSLGYINNCHAILFVLRATQPCTLNERRYLENYLKDRGLTVFFLINAWDQIKESLIDPDDLEELAEAELKLKKVFKTNLHEYCQIDGYDLYEERVFEVSSLMALRRRLKNPEASLDDTGFTKFITALNTFLTKERAIAQLRQGRTLARQTYGKVKNVIARRIPLLEKDVKELKSKISSVEPEFQLLNEICIKFQEVIKTTRNNKAKSISESFRDYILNLGNTFEADFFRYQPELNLLDFLSSGKREAFERELRKAFESYINDKLSAWSREAEKEMETAFGQLSQLAVSYGADYSKITDKITEKLTGQSIPPLPGFSQEDNSPSWAKWAAGIFSLARGNIAGFALAGAGFDWKNIMLNFIAVLGVGSIITALTGVVLGPLGFALLGLGIGFLQADQAKKELVKTAKKELVKYLPEVAREQTPKIEAAIKDCFDIYEREITQRINEDIQSRKNELDNLVKQKESIEIDRESEILRLKNLEEKINGETQKIENIYQDFLNFYAREA
jgi:replication fork clamp-binding protein CrfC